MVKRKGDIKLSLIGASIVGYEKILLTRRKREPGKGLWSIPEGLVELRETAKDALRRRVKEETNLEVKVLKPIEF